MIKMKHDINLYVGGFLEAVLWSLIWTMIIVTYVWFISFFTIGDYMELTVTVYILMIGVHLLGMAGVMISTARKLNKLDAKS